MIPRADIAEWRDSGHQWSADDQVEQDLILGRILVEMFSDSSIAGKLICRGGTALHKLFFPKPLRYSEDIDVVQRGPGPIGPVFDEIRNVLDRWLGLPRRELGRGVARLTYRTESEDNPPRPLKIKVEINTREHFQVLPIERKKFRVRSRWFTGEADIPVYGTDELLATKMRALYQRRKGRDLFDLGAALRALNVSPGSIIATFQQYCEAAGQKITGKEYRSNLLKKLEHPGFLSDCMPLLRPGVEFVPQSDFDLVDRELISRMAGR